MGFSQTPPPPALRELAECVWTSDSARPARILPDGCMDLIAIGDDVLVAGPDTTAFVSDQRGTAAGIRFRPGVLPRLLNVPAAELRDTRMPLRELRPEVSARTLLAAAERLMADRPKQETSPWSLAMLAVVTTRLRDGAAVGAVAEELGWSARTLQRQCSAVYGYSPAMVRRVLRFRTAVGLLRAGIPMADTAFRVGYADQPHLHRDVRALAGVPPSQLPSAAYRSTDVPSGSVTVA